MFLLIGKFPAIIVLNLMSFPCVPEIAFKLPTEENLCIVFFVLHKKIVFFSGLKIKNITNLCIAPIKFKVIRQIS